MKIIIVGAGELGRLLAATLCEGRHDVVIVDSSDEGLERLKDKLDVMTVEGSCASVATLKRAGVADADALLAVSGDEAANILSCQIASRLGVKRTICRLYSSDCFSEEDGVTPEAFGVWRVFSPPEECVAKILSVLESKIVLEKIRFSNPDALMTVFEVTPSSLLAGTRVKDIPGPEMINSIRFAAIVRDRQFLIPHGDTIFIPGDKVYVAGHRERVSEFIRWISPDDSQLSRILIAGATDTGKALAERLCPTGCELRFIEKDQRKGERLLDELPAGIMVINGDPTDEEVLDEAGIDGCDAFISAAEDDEDNILCCIMAKRLGAKKVVTLTYKPEYIKIVPAMDTIDCGFSSTLVSVNVILRMLEAGTMRIDAILQRFHAHLTEFKIHRDSPVCGKPLSQCELPPSAVFALVFRDGEVLSPSGDSSLAPGDTVVAIVTPDSAQELEPLLLKKGLQRR